MIVLRRGRNCCYHRFVRTVEKLSIALPTEMAALLRKAVKSGEYASASEVVRDALRTWNHKRKLETLELGELRRLIREGADSGQGIDAERVFSRLDSKYAAKLV
jgi:antitoxin ParD1/3/4